MAMVITKSNSDSLKDKIKRRYMRKNKLEPSKRLAHSKFYAGDKGNQENRTCEQSNPKVEDLINLKENKYSTQNKITEILNGREQISRELDFNDVYTEINIYDSLDWSMQDNDVITEMILYWPFNGMIYYEIYFDDSLNN